MTISNDIHNLIILCFAILVFVYAYNDYIKPIVINTIKIINGKSLHSTISEAFTSQYSSLSPSMSNHVDFDTNYYLRDADKPIIINNKIALPLIKYCYFTNGSYEYLVGNYFRKHIYPVTQIQSISNIDALYKFINNEIDIAFISEELLSRYIKKDCRYLTRLLAQSFNLSTTNLNPAENELLLHTIYPPLNISAIGVGFNIDFYLIVNNFSPILEFIDIKYIKDYSNSKTIDTSQDKKIGILADSYYFYIKICAAYGIDITSSEYINTHIVEPDLEILINKFTQNEYDAIFVVVNAKNTQLITMSKNMLVRYIHIQKKETLDARKNLSNLINFTNNNQQGTNSETNIPPPPTLNTQAIYSQNLLNDLKTNNIKENFNSMIKKYFRNISPLAVDLNKFHKSENKQTYLDTFTTRMILMIRNDIPKDKVEYITRNYINNLEKMRNTIDMEEFDAKINNSSTLEFNYEELVSFDNTIPMAAGAKDVYKKEGLIYYEEDVRCRI